MGTCESIPVTAGEKKNIDVVNKMFTLWKIAMKAKDPALLDPIGEFTADNVTMSTPLSDIFKNATNKEEFIAHLKMMCLSDMRIDLAPAKLKASYLQGLTPSGDLVCFKNLYSSMTVPKTGRTYNPGTLILETHHLTFNSDNLISNWEVILSDEHANALAQCFIPEPPALETETGTAGVVAVGEATTTASKEQGGSDLAAMILPVDPASPSDPSERVLPAASV